jgi:hypothetical protein
MRAGRSRAARLAVGVTAALGVYGLVPAAARDKVDSFDGACSTQGTVRFSPPATNAQQQLSVSYEAGGSCSGTLNGRHVDNAVVRVHQAGHSAGSCPHADTTGPGQGTMVFPDGTTIRYTFEFHFVGTDGVFLFHGQRSGTGWGHGTFLTQRTSTDVTRQCAAEGVREIPMDMSLNTDSPFVSTSKGSDGARPQGQGRQSERLRLVARPRSVRVGRRTLIAFRVSTPAGQPARGALLRFAGRRARSNRRGAVSVAITLRHPGRFGARASKRGFGVARTSVRARRG